MLERVCQKAQEEMCSLRKDNNDIIASSNILRENQCAIMKELDFVIQDRNLCCQELTSMKRKNGNTEENIIDDPSSSLPNKKMKAGEMSTVDDNTLHCDNNNNDFPQLWSAIDHI